MKFDDLDAKLRQYETMHDTFVPAQTHIVMRLDGRGFTKKVNEIWQLNRPFDDNFHQAMIKTTYHLMNIGFKVIYGYTQSDEISLLLHLDENGFNRKTRKLLSIFAGEASGVFSLQIGSPACFDARICVLPATDLVKDYFSWRQEDAHRNGLNTHCYWLLRQQGNSPASCDAFLSHQSSQAKLALLMQHGIDFDLVANWQKWGVGIYWHTTQKQGFNPKTGEQTTTTRNALIINEQLPTGDEYRSLIDQILTP